MENNLIERSLCEAEFPSELCLKSGSAEVSAEKMEKMDQQFEQKSLFFYFTYFTKAEQRLTS